MNKRITGPWSSIERLPGRIDIHSSDGEWIAVLKCVDNREANARLITAAPDLLMWARDLVERLNERGIKFDADTADSIRMLQKAIAKAEGRKP